MIHSAAALFDQLLEGGLHHLVPHLVALGRQMDMVWHEQFGLLVAKTILKVNRKVEIVHSSVVSESRDDTFEIVHNLVGFGGLAWQNTEQQYLGFGHFSVQRLQNSMNSLGDIRSWIGSNVVRTWR